MKKPLNAMERPTHFFKTLKTLLGYYKGKKGVGLAFVIFLTIISGGSSLVGTFFTGIVVDEIHAYIKNPAVITPLIQNILILAAIFIAGIISTLVCNILMIRISQRVIAQIKQELFEHTLKLPLSTFDKTPKGNIMSYFTNTMESMNDMLNQGIPNVIVTTVNIIGTLIGLFVLNVYVSFVVVGFMIVMAVYIVINMRQAKKVFAEQHQVIADLNGFVEENVNGLKVKHSINHDKEDLEVFDSLNKNLTRVSAKSFFHTQLNTPVIVSLSYLNLAVACVLLIVLGYYGHIPFSIGLLTSYLMYVRQSAHPFAFFTNQVNAMMNAMAGAERIFKFKSFPTEIDDGKITLVNLENGELSFKEKYAWKIPMANNEFKLIPLKGEIKFNNVSFGYTDKKLILDNISLYANEGEKIAFVGSTGAGKTTIASLISRFYEINEGEITYDGINIKDIKKESLRRSMSLVAQETHLFTGTIKDNILYPRRHSSFKEVKEAAKIANASNFIERLPQGYDTMIYDDGNGLSDGQKQLIALARASICKPPVLILDEATSNIDTHTERLVQKSMNTLMENRTVLVIAHNLATVQNSEAILCLEHGKIIERGSHEELLSQKGYYYNLCKGKSELN